MKRLNTSKTERLRVKCLFYPEMQFKVYWDLWLTIALIVSCITTPIDIAFSNHDKDWSPHYIVNLTLDIIFLIDIFFCFFSAYEDETSEIVDNRKKVAINYLSGWFIIDVLAIFPL